MPGGKNAVDLVCGQREQIPMVLAVVVVMGLLLAFSFLFVSPGDRAYPIAVLDAVLVVGSLLGFGGTYWYCTRRAMAD